MSAKVKPRPTDWLKIVDENSWWWAGIAITFIVMQGLLNG